MARILICGTLAYDDIGEFGSALGAETRNVKLDRLHRGFGGCAMNIAYNLAGLGHEAVPFVYAGDDYAGGHAGGSYARHVAAHGISEAGIFCLTGLSSARGIVLTGRDGVQFTAFYPGPSGEHRWQRDLAALLRGPCYDAAIVAPDLPDKMAGCASRLASVPLLVWSPGQYAEHLDGAIIREVLETHPLLVANSHEWHALGRTVSAGELHRGCRAVVVTDGAGPVTLWPEDRRVPVPPVEAAGIDPTGCGDAFLAALTHALLAGRDLAAAAAAGIVLAGRCLTCPGAQSHYVTPDPGQPARLQDDD